MVVGTNNVDGVDEQECRDLVHRIVSTPSFQRSARLRDLLSYLTEQTLSRDSRGLTENKIGRAVFGKPLDYSPVEDSSVRVHVRQLRLKLHEYFAEDGRNESLVIEIPKGSYGVVFRTVENSLHGADPVAVPAVVEEPEPAQPERPRIRWMIVMPWMLVVVLAAALGYSLWPRPHVAGVSAPSIQWPLSAVFDGSHRTYVVLADANYGMFRIIGRRSGSLNDYLDSDYPRQFLPASEKDLDPELRSFLTGSVLTSYADAVIAARLVNITNGTPTAVVLRAARDVSLRDFGDGNFVLLGSPAANPWVTLYEQKLNFREEDTRLSGGGPKFFENMHPQAGEDARYLGLSDPGKTGVNYASIALLPSITGSGSVLIVQGLQQDGTEAAGVFLGKPENLARLRSALGIPGTPSSPVYFEALLRTRTVSGMPSSTEIVATRRIQ